VARTRSLSTFILGGGSNLLISDSGFDGVVIHVDLRA
jgi:UDP-N-acetylmuramate dehydrogenase